MKRVIAIIMVMLFIVLSSTQGLEVKAETGASTVKQSSIDITELVPNLISNSEDLETAQKYDITFDDNERVMILPVNIIAKGGLFVSLFADDMNYGSLIVTLYKDNECKQKYGNSVYLFDDKNSSSKDLLIENGGTYFMKFELSKKKDSGAITFQMQLDYVSSEDKELTIEETSLQYQTYDSSDITYKVVAETSGLLTLTMNSDAETGLSAKLQLLDKDKKALTDEKYSSIKKEEGLKKYYVVSKGTYFIKVKISCGMYGISYDVNEVKDKSGTSKSKAAVIKMGGSAIKGMCTITDKTTKEDWFKFTLTSDKSIKITLKHVIDGKLKVDILDSKGDSLWYGSRTMYEGDKELVLESNGKFSKGTYYIKVYKYDKISSGSYSVQVK